MPDELDFVRRATNFVFLWWQDDERGVFVTREHYDFMERFIEARKSARTWGEFWSRLSMWMKDYIACYIHNSPDDNVILAEADQWIFEDQEFPITQCAAETCEYATFSILDCVPEAVLKECGFSSTEYHARIYFYPKSWFVEMKECMESQGCYVESKLSPFEKICVTTAVRILF